jgi:RimJ/RimL family protein N-acetyltransferase
MAAAVVIQRRQLRLEPFNEAHFTPSYVSWLNDPDVMRFSEHRHRRHDEASCRAFVQGLRAGGHPFWAIVAEDLGHVGNIAVYLDRPNRLAEITLLIGERAAWGRGYGTGAWGAVMDWVFANEGVRKIVAGTMASNLGMIAVMERCGMVREAVRPRQFLVDGAEVDAVFYARFNEPRSA